MNTVDKQLLLTLQKDLTSTLYESRYHLLFLFHRNRITLPLSYEMYNVLDVLLSMYQ